MLASTNLLTISGRFFSPCPSVWLCVEWLCQIGPTSDRWLNLVYVTDITLKSHCNDTCVGEPPTSSLRSSYMTQKQLWYALLCSLSSCLSMLYQRCTRGHSNALTVTDVTSSNHTSQTWEQPAPPLQHCPRNSGSP